MYNQLTATNVTALPIVGVVLAGGKSTRLGVDKANLRLANSKITLLEHLTTLLASVCPAVLVSGRSVPFAPHVADSPSGCGPLGGIIAALQACNGAACCVISCDLPKLNQRVLTKLIAAHNNKPPNTLVTMFTSPTGKAEPLVAVYEVGAIPYLQQQVATGYYALNAAIPLFAQQRICYSANESEAFFNLNTPQDMAKIVNTTFCPLCYPKE